MATPNAAAGATSSSVSKSDPATEAVRVEEAVAEKIGITPDLQATAETKGGGKEMSADLQKPKEIKQENQDVLSGNGKVSSDTLADLGLASLKLKLGKKLGKKLELIASVLELEAHELEEENAPDAQSNLTRQVGILRKLAEETRQGKFLGPEDKNDEDTDSGDDDDDDKPVCKVERVDMEDFQKDNGTGTQKTVIKAFYRNLSAFQNANNSKESNTTVKERMERPQRIAIASNPLLYDLEEIAGQVETHRPLVLAHPFKLLVKYYPDLVERLSKLETQLAQFDKEKTKIDSTGNQSPKGLDKPAQAPDISQSTIDGLDHVALTLDAPTSSHVSPVTVASSDPLERKSLDKSDERVVQNKEDEKSGKKRKELVTRIEHLRLLIDFVKVDLSYHIDLHRDSKAGNLEKVLFEDLWYLYEPGDIVLFRNQGHDQLCKVYAVTGGQQRKRAPNKNETMEKSLLNRADREDKKDATIMTGLGYGTWSPLIIDYYILEFDGHLVGPKDARHQIKYYSGERKITDLPAYPLRFRKDRAEITEKLIKRGQKYISSYGHKSYHGMTCPLDPLQTPEDLRGDVFIDFNDYYRGNSSLKPTLGVLHRTNPDIAEVEEDAKNAMWYFCDHEVDQRATERFMSLQPDLEPVELVSYQHSADTLQLLPYRVPAYNFRSRKYVQLDIDVVAEIDKSDEARDRGFEDLIIPDSHRNLLTALVKTQVKDSTSTLGPKIAATQLDIVRGKGQGLIILLHGPPGSGKTSTAETLAAHSRRPLYPITCGDLGTTPEKVEIALMEHTERAQRWGCILLLDEADVFLSRRDWRDTNHNALVSVFLRQLEYYSGILFLTTNRVGVIDEAFKSRIHVSLAYPTIRLPETMDIWAGILTRIEKDNKTAAIKIKFDRTALLTFAKNHYNSHKSTGTAWNGRQIRNAFQLAIALGHHERSQKLEAAGLTTEEAAKSGDKKWMMVKLTTANFRSIAETARKFEDFLVVVRGHDSERAKHMSLRYDGPIDEAITGQAPRTRKDYAFHDQIQVSARSARRVESSLYLTPERDVNRLSSSRERRSRSGSNSQQNRSLEEEDNIENLEQEEEEDIFEEISDEN
ncbi:ATPase family AAA domain-containing protein [Paramyrothecium foliicola]|nr:ATPase family AAA domain-containing protein [Paramyrothecium foliicola]